MKRSKMTTKTQMNNREMQNNYEEMQNAYKETTKRRIRATKRHHWPFFTPLVRSDPLQDRLQFFIQKKTLEHLKPVKTQSGSV